MVAMFRGTGIVPVVQLFISKHGMDSYKKLVSYLSPEYRDLYLDPTEVLVGKSYPLHSHVEMLDAMDTYFYPDLSTDKWLPEYMLHQMNFGLNVFYRIIIKLVNVAAKPAHFATFTMRLWRRYHDTGNYYVLEGSKTDLTMVLTNFEGNDYPIFIDALKHCFIAALSLSKAKNVTCKTRKNRKLNGVEYHLAWDKLEAKSKSPSIEPLLRGTAIVPFINYFIHLHGLEKYKEVVSKLSPEYQKIYENPDLIHLEESYPELSHIEMLEIINEQIYPNIALDEWLCDYMREQMNFGMNIFYKFAFNFMAYVKKPLQFAEWTLQFWYKYHNTGELLVITGKKNNHIKYHLKNFIGNTYEVSRTAIMCATKHAVSISGGKNVECTYKVLPKGDIVEFDIQWD